MTCTYDIIGFGTYSIVISPPIANHTTEVKKYENPQKNDVCKIFRTEQDCRDDFQDEVYMLNKIASIPDYTNFTVQFKGASIFDVSEVSNDSRILKHIMQDDYYSLYKRIFSNTYKQLYEITFGNGGTCINKLTQKIEFAKFISIISQFYKGILTLHENDIIHRDIKPTNVLYDEDKLNIIDFGLACDINDVYDFHKSHFLLHCHYPFNPPEFYMASHLYGNVLQNNNDFDECLKDTFSIFREDNETFKKYFASHIYDPIGKPMTTIEMYASAFHEMFEDIKKRNLKITDEIFTKDMAQKADVFATSFVVKNLKKYIVFQNDEQIDFYETLYEMTCNLNPYRRSNVPEILQFINTLGG